MVNTDKWKLVTFAANLYEMNSFGWYMLTRGGKSGSTSVLFLLALFSLWGSQQVGGRGVYGEIRAENILDVYILDPDPLFASIAFC